MVITALVLDSTPSPSISNAGSRHSDADTGKVMGRLLELYEERGMGWLPQPQVTSSIITINGRITLDSTPIGNLLGSDILRDRFAAC